MEDFKKAINTLFDLFDKLSEADTSPSANYSMPEMFMRRALKGDEKAKKALAVNISDGLNTSLKIVEIALDEWINNKRNIKENTNMKRKIRLTESDLHRIVKESVEKILSESDYDNFFDWAKNSGASPEEIDAAAQRHDSRIPSIYADYDKLERRQKNNERYRKQIGHGYITPSTMRDYQKFDIKNDKSGGKMFTDRLMKGLIPKNFRN